MTQAQIRESGLQTKAVATPQQTVAPKTVTINKATVAATAAGATVTTPAKATIVKQVLTTQGQQTPAKQQTAVVKQVAGTPVQKIATPANIVVSGGQIVQQQMVLQGNQIVAASPGQQVRILMIS